MSADQNHYKQNISPVDAPQTHGGKIYDLVGGRKMYLSLFFIFLFSYYHYYLCVCVWEGGAEFSSKCFPGINEIITSSMFAPYGLNYRMLNAHNKIWINKTEV